MLSQQTCAAGLSACTFQSPEWAHRETGNTKTAQRREEPGGSGAIALGLLVARSSGKLSVRPGFRNLAEGSQEIIWEMLFSAKCSCPRSPECQSSQEKGTEKSPVVKLKHPLESP